MVSIIGCKVIVPSTGQTHQPQRQSEYEHYGIVLMPVIVITPQGKIKGCVINKRKSNGSLRNC